MENFLLALKNRTVENRITRHFAVSWLILQAQKQIYSEATESNSLRKFRAIVWINNIGFWILEDNAVIIRKWVDGDGYTLDTDDHDLSDLLIYVTLLPFGILIHNQGSPGEVSLKGKPLAPETRWLLTASAKIKIGACEGHIRIDGNPEDVQANLMFVSTKYPDIFCKDCKRITIQSEDVIRLHQEAEHCGFFDKEALSLMNQQYSKMDEMSVSQLSQLGTQYSQYLDEQPEAIELCICMGQRSKL